MSYDYGKERPFPEAAETGRKFITPCCTSAVIEYLVNGELWLCGRVAGHGYSSPIKGSIDEINDTGTICEPGNPERHIRWSAAKERQHG